MSAAAQLGHASEDVTNTYYIVDSGIPAAEILNATLTLPPWPKSPFPGCTSGPVTFTNGTSSQPYSVAMLGSRQMSTSTTMAAPSQ